MDIFIMKTLEPDERHKKLFKEFQKKEISNEKKWNTHCFSYLMLDRILLNVYKIENRGIVFRNKKPILESGEKNFSISHCGDVIVIAFSDYNCGIDIEKIKERDYEKVSQRMKFSVQNLEEFYEKWTEFEANYKLQGETKSLKTFTIGDYKLTAVSEFEDEKFELYFQN